MRNDSAFNEAVARVLNGPKGKSVGAFFDFDGTLIDGFSAGAYYIDRMKKGLMGGREILDTLRMAAKKGMTDDEFDTLIRKSIVEWAGVPETRMRELWQRLWVEKIATTTFPETWKLIQAHRKMGHTIAIASSAMPYQIEPLAQEYGIDHILATQPKIRDGRLTGGIEGNPLWGQGKADAVREFARQKRIDLAKSYGYANGDEDIAFLETVGRATAVQPKPQLQMHAAKAGWPELHLPQRNRGSVKQMARTVGAYGAMGLTFAAGLGYLKATDRRREAIDWIAATSTDTAFDILGIKLEIEGQEHLEAHRPCVFLFNHQSKFDTFLIINLVRHGVTGVAKAESRSVPGIGDFMELADVAFVERNNPAKARQAMDPVVDRLRRGLSICIAPEGTRSWTPKLGPFKKGAFHIAMQAGRPLVPVVMHNTWEIMGRNDQTMRSGTLRVTVLPPVYTDGWTPDNMNDKVASVRQMFVDTLEETIEI